MEALAISTARSTLNSVIKIASIAITDEIGIPLGVQEELFFIKEELEMMRAFLRAASSEKVKGEIVTTWIKQVRELAFDVEDCLQEASILLVKKGCLPAMCSVKKRSNIARKIRVLKTRIEDVSKRNLRYNLINTENGGPAYDDSSYTRLIAGVESLLVGLDEPKRKLVELILKEHADRKVISVIGMGGLGKTTLARKVYGCQEVRDEFKCFAWINVLHPFNMEEYIQSVANQIPLDGQEDDNKERTMEEKATRYLKDKKYLIVLDDLSSTSEWDKIKDVLPTGNGTRIIVTTRLKPLAEYISHTSDNIYEIEKLSENDAFDLFCKVVCGTHNYSLVIDDKETKDDPPQGNKCSMKYDPNSTEITDDNSEEQTQCFTVTITKDMKFQAGLIINSCGRLPLAIVTVGSYLATKPKTSAEWKIMYDHLSSEFANNPDLGVVKTVLTSSYDGMPYHLKPCLLYLSVFNNHKEIRRSRIIRRWMADGCVMESHKKTAEQVGKSYFYDLMGRSLIQPSQMSTIVNGDIKRCNIHDMMYELILAKAVDENIVSLLEDENLITVTNKVRHLVITGGSCNGDKVLARMKLSHMRSVSIFGPVGNYLRYHRMKLVRVLDLEGSLNLDNRDLRIIGKLHHLKYLGLRGTKITKLPCSLGKLGELETLDIRNTDVARLPRGLAKLQKLSYIRAGYDGIRYKPYDSIAILMLILICWPVLADITNISATRRVTGYIVTLFCLVCCCGPSICLSLCLGDDDNKESFTYGVRPPQGIGELRSLNILGMINIGRSKGLAKELQNLTNLRKLAVIGFIEENGKILAKVIDGLKQLRSLVLEASNNSGLKCCLDSVSSPPKYLQSLKLYSPLGELPDWISSLENLEKIHFRKTKLIGEIKAIEKLPNLKILYMLEDSFKEEIKELCLDEGTFPMLQVMIVEGLEGLELVSIGKTALKRLEQLKINRCKCIREGGVLGMEFLIQLKEMEVGLCYGNKTSNEEFVRYIKEQLKKLPKEPVLKVSQ